MARIENRMARTFRDDAVIIVSATFCRGWTGHDHLLDDEQLRPLLGEEYPSTAVAKRAADEFASELPGRRAPVTIETKTVKEIDEQRRLAKLEDDVSE